MSNLKLPTMTLESLERMPSDRLAYATTKREAGRDCIVVEHHGSPIATLEPSVVHISNAGWSSQTTSARINKVLSDNGIPYYTAIRQGIMHLFNRAEGHIDTGTFASAMFQQDWNGWHLIWRNY